MSDFTKNRISKSDSWTTPKEIYDDLDQEFHFNDDPCPLDGIGGLERDWGTSVFMNPPYSNPYPWCKKAYEESLKGRIVVGLLRGDTSTKWFHDYIWNAEKHCCRDGVKVRFVKGRIKFNGKPAPFASIIAIWGEK